MKIFGETTELLASDSENPTELGQDFDNYWNEKKGASILEAAREMIQSLEMRLVELATQEMQIAGSDEFERLDKIPTSSEDASQLRATLNDLMAIIAPLSRAESHIDAREYKNKNIARRAREGMESVEFQLKQLLSIEGDEPTTNRRRSPTPPPRTPPTTPALLPSLIEKGR
ncbi:unnamed protein product [Cylicocyclus nassatus]|uniref:Uncharacterized protein n=1 Tax=Cylicocyclus nassatus TaxID=53992 RepID=A0AA36MEZ0_CYLNA|nr:unnamed protein product [Cylicocyclus nassatus]